MTRHSEDHIRFTMETVSPRDGDLVVARLSRLLPERSMRWFDKVLDRVGAELGWPDRGVRTLTVTDLVPSIAVVSRVGTPPEEDMRPPFVSVQPSRVATGKGFWDVVIAVPSQGEFRGSTSYGDVADAEESAEKTAAQLDLPYVGVFRFK